jgi:hypothetical protein
MSPFFHVFLLKNNDFNRASRFLAHIRRDRGPDEDVSLLLSPFIAARVAGTSASPVRLVSSGIDRILLSACWQQKRREARRQGRLQSLLMVVDSRRIALQQNQAFAKKTRCRPQWRGDSRYATASNFRGSDGFPVGRELRPKTTLDFFFKSLPRTQAGT